MSLTGSPGGGHHLLSRPDPRGARPHFVSFAEGESMAGDHIPMTKAGANAIKREIKRLKAVERPRIVQEISVARDHGDLSEHAEHPAATERQSPIPGRRQ